MAVVMSRLLRCHSHAEGCRDRVGGMSTCERVILAFLWARERLYAVQLAVGAEAVASSREDLVAIGLMPHVPHYAVVGGVEDIMQGHGQLHHA